MIVRPARPDELQAICEFGAAHIPGHYRPLIGPAAAQAQVDDWWTPERMSPAIEAGRVIVAEDDGEIVGVAEWSLFEGVPTLWKLYVHPARQGEGIGPQLISAVVDDVSGTAERLRVETFAANRRACAFYWREGFRRLRTPEHVDPAPGVVWFERSLG